MDLENPPFGFLDQDDFYNAVIVIQVDMQAKELLSYLLRLEKKFGRKRSFANAPRTLDLDIIFFEDIKRLLHRAQIWDSWPRCND